MQIKCKVCHKVIEIDESQYNPGDEIEVVCRRCGESISVEIPNVSVDESKPSGHEVVSVNGKPKNAVPPTQKDVSTEEDVTAKEEASETSGEEAPQPQELPTNAATPVKRKRKTASPAKTSAKTDDKAGSTTKKKTIKPKTKEASSVSEAVPPKDSSQNSGTSDSISDVGCGCVIIILIVLVLCGGGFWLFKSCSRDKSSDASEAVASAVVADTIAVMEEAVAEEMPDEVYDCVTIAGDLVEEPEENIVLHEVGPMGFHSGMNVFSGNMIHTDGRKFPFSLSFYYDSDTGKISEVRYKNIGSGTTLSLVCHSFDGESVNLYGMDGNKEFIIEFSGDGPYTGDAWWGDFHQDIELSLK